MQGVVRFIIAAADGANDIRAQTQTDDHIEFADNDDLICWSLGRGKPMPLPIRELCLREIAADGYDRRAYELATDAALARGVLDTRRDDAFRRSL
jgi:hypothetical protein